MAFSSLGGAPKKNLTPSGLGLKVTIVRFLNLAFHKYVTETVPACGEADPGNGARKRKCRKSMPGDVIVIVLKTVFWRLLPQNSIFVEVHKINCMQTIGKTDWWSWIHQQRSAPILLWIVTVKCGNCCCKCAHHMIAPPREPLFVLFSCGPARCTDLLRRSHKLVLGAALTRFFQWRKSCRPCQILLSLTK